MFNCMQEAAEKAAEAYCAGNDEEADSLILSLRQLCGGHPDLDDRRLLADAGLPEAIAARMANLALRKRPIELKLHRRRLLTYVTQEQADQLIATAFAIKAARNSKYRAKILKRALRNASHTAVDAAFGLAGLSTRTPRYPISPCSMLQATKG